MAELAQMFKDFALIVEQQGELLDQIEYQVKAASEYIDEGNVQMTEAIEIQISIRKKQCMCAAAVVVCIIIIVVVCWVYLGHPSSGSSSGSSPTAAPASVPAPASAPTLATFSARSFTNIFGRPILQQLSSHRHLR